MAKNAFPKCIKSIGVEVEGGFNPHHRERGPKGGGAFHDDGSVRVEGSHVWNGEVCSPRLESWDALTKWTCDNYPIVVNATCGIHMHLTFTHPKYFTWFCSVGDFFYSLAETHFTKWMKERAGDLAHWEKAYFTNRLEGNNSFCRHEWNLGDLGSRRDLYDRGRYAGVNFQAWSKHRTLELRQLPSFQSKRVACSAMREYIVLFLKATRLGRARCKLNASNTLRIKGDTIVEELQPPKGPMTANFMWNGGTVLREMARRRGIQRPVARTRDPNRHGDFEIELEQVRGGL